MKENFELNEKKTGGGSLMGVHESLEPMVIYFERAIQHFQTITTMADDGQTTSVKNTYAMNS